MAVPPAAKRARVVSCTTDPLLTLVDSTPCAGEDKLDAALPEVCNREVIAGPDVKSLFVTLDARPKVVPADKGLVAKMSAAQDALKSAQADVSAASTLSPALQSAAAKLQQEATKVLNALVALEAKAQPKRILTAAELDVKRAETYEAIVAFEEKESKRLATVREDVAVMVQETRNAREALQAQEAALVQALVHYSESWEVHSDKLLAGMNAKLDSYKSQLAEALLASPAIAAKAPLEETPSAVQPTPVVGPPCASAELLQFRTMIGQMEAKLAEQTAHTARLMKTASDHHHATLADWQTRYDSLEAEASLLRSAAPACVPLTPAEMEERKKHKEEQVGRNVEEVADGAVNQY